MMKAKTEEFLNLLLWSADLLARPTFRNLTDSYEGWAYRHGWLKQVSRLEQRQLIERDSGSPDDRLYRLSAQGRLHVLGGRDPEERWARHWDGQWRLVLFVATACRSAPGRPSANKHVSCQVVMDNFMLHMQHSSVLLSPHPSSLSPRVAPASLVPARGGHGEGQVPLE
jgi:hypothetical protein